MKELRSLAVLAMALLVLSACGSEEEPRPDEAPVTPSVVAPERPAADGTPPAAKPDEPDEATSMLNDIDRDFATRAFGSSIAHVQAGRLAAEKTLDEDVRQFAQEMVKDHTASNEELTKIAQAKKLELPMAPLTSFKEALQQLTTMTGPQHNRFYMDRFGAAAHRDALELYEREIREGQDPDLKRFAERMVPVLRRHLEFAEKTREGIETTR